MLGRWCVGAAPQPLHLSQTYCSLPIAKWMIYEGNCIQYWKSCVGIQDLGDTAIRSYLGLFTYYWIVNIFLTFILLYISPSYL